MKQPKLLMVKRTISKARDTKGYNVVTIWDGNTRYKAIGGGYDMLGTAFAKWLWVHYRQRIEATLKYINYDVPECEREQGFCGYFYKNGFTWINGGCGLETMLRIAKLIGLNVSRNHDRKGCYITSFFVTDLKEDA